MPTDEPPRRRRGTTKRRTESSASHTAACKDESVLSREPDTSERPASLADLRKARLSYIETPPEERRRRMKYEYTKTVKVKEEVGTRSREGSTVSRAKSSRSSTTRADRSRSSKAPEVIQEVEEDQYVYGSTRARDKMPGAFGSDGGREDRGERTHRRTESKSTGVSRRKTERRNTEPVVIQSSRVEREVSRESSRPQPRRSTTGPSKPKRTVPRRSSTPVLPGSIHAIPDPELPPSARPPKKSTSIFGTFFASKPQSVLRKVSCLTCGDDVLITKTAKLPCSHRMCHSCLERIFKLAVTDPAHMPPRCCTEQAISLQHVDSLFDTEFKKVYNRKLNEYKTKNKIYCPARGCGEWIQPKHIKMDKGRKIGKCPACKTNVCGICSQKMHKTRDCPKDPATKAFVETAKEAGWQKCYNCNAMVELKEGCNHMTCRCTAEFCMVCGLKWKSCECPWFSYDRADVQGDPVRYQQEMDRRREQERIDEAIARRMAGVQLETGRAANWGWGGFLNHGRDDELFATADQLPDRHNRRQRRAMPGGWDDGPQQFQEVPPVPGRYARDDAFDPAGTNHGGRVPLPEPLERAGPEGIPVIRHRSHRRRGTATVADPAIATGAAAAGGFFEGRTLTANEREQERLIRAWATGMPRD